MSRMSEKIPHMVEQIIKFSDGTETVIKYRGVIENGILMEDQPNVGAEAVPEPEEVVEAALAEEKVEE